MPTPEYPSLQPERNSLTDDIVRPIRDDRPRWFSMQVEAIEVYAKIVGPSAFVVYALLCSSAGTDKRCYPSRATIATTLGMSRETVTTAIRKLVAANMIETYERYAEEDGARLRDLIVLRDLHSGGPSRSDPPPRIPQGVPQNSGPNCTGATFGDGTRPYQGAGVAPSGASDIRQDVGEDEDRYLAPPPATDAHARTERPRDKSTTSLSSTTSTDERTTR